MGHLRILLWSLLCSITMLYAQKPSTNKKAQAAFLEAGKALRLNNYAQAQAQLLIAVSQDPTFATAYQQLGDSYRKTENYEQAVSAYQSVVRLDPQLTSLTYFGLGQSLLFTGQYEEAKQQLEHYKKIAKLSDKSLALTDKYIKDCIFSIANSSSPSLLSLVPLGSEINTEHDEYFPKLTADNKTIIFTRKTANQENFYESHLENGNWSVAQKLEGTINSENYNEGAHCISPDGKYLFFTACNWPDGLGSCDIYVAKRENGIWGKPHNLGAPINTKGWESQPAISADGKTLYFVSNRTGSIGGYDIYKSTLKADGTWNTPQNLGPTINSPYDESAPYIHPDNKTLYFASDGWPGFGRKDIFQSTLGEDGNWSIPVNLGPSINNFRDQVALHVSMNGKIGHLAAQDSAGQQDIYRFEVPQYQRPGAIAYIKGEVRDALTNAPLRALISVTNTETNERVFEDDSDILDGQFLATLPLGHNYAVHVQSEGYLFDSRQYALDNPAFANESFYVPIRLSPITVGSSSQLSNIYFDTNSAHVLPQSEADLAALTAFLKTNAQLQIEIAGHTDNTGTVQGNITLSEERAKAVRKRLVERGIAEKRLIIKGYGQSVPVADNGTEAGRRLNRRTTFTVIALQASR